MSERIIYELENEGIVRVIQSRTNIGKVEDFLKSQISAQPIDLPAFSISSRGKPLHASVSTKNLVVYERLSVLPLETWWLLQGDATLIPFWSSNDTRVVRYRFNWEPPEDMALYLVGTFLFQNSARSYKYSYAQLVAVGKDELRYRLPFSNLYPDCRICIGDGANVGGATYGQAMDNLLDSIIRNPWGGDLMNPNGIQEVDQRLMAGQFIRFTSNGRQLPVVEDSEKHWTKLSNVASNDSINRMNKDYLWM